MTEYKKEEKALRKNLERLKAERLAREKISRMTPSGITGRYSSLGDSLSPTALSPADFLPSASSTVPAPSR